MRSVMKVSMVFRILLTAILAGLFASPITPVYSQQYSHQAIEDKPPEIFQGGEWSDHFLTDQWISEKDNTEWPAGHLLLKLTEHLHWTQTWTVHFAGGEFFQTEAISDSVRLAPNGIGQYFTTGVYTSTVFNAGRPVDWSSSAWTFLGMPDSLILEYRTGNTPNPDNTWTSWGSPRRVIGEFLCVYTIFGETECATFMSGIESSQYVQYRASFSSNDPAKTIVLYDADLVYGIHPVTGTATSVAVSPVDLSVWKNVIISSSVPVSTTLAIDILAPDGKVLIQNATNGDSLASIDPHEYPAIKLRATFTTADPSLTPDVDMWGLRWSVKLYLPLILR